MDQVMGLRGAGEAMECEGVETMRKIKQRMHANETREVQEEKCDYGQNVTCSES